MNVILARMSWTWEFRSQSATLHFEGALMKLGSFVNPFKSNTR